ncbi:unnamed protein product [Durusdinium trenchii]|uniref:Uncharacterized protein n=1 Tax=Durusdinium trenchii TaxID=1381693 RepID=A0ABP0RVN3_9DINO
MNAVIFFDLPRRTHSSLPTTAKLSSESFVSPASTCAESAKLWTHLRRRMWPGGPSCTIEFTRCSRS